mmetsp:Transcript_2323/g.6748  ORF Transcript_2323/g.6748 Transcript_2323/m.6748 type:complete len:217 (-) Transcript_2323:522-1172(-)
MPCAASNASVPSAISKPSPPRARFLAHSATHRIFGWPTLDDHPRRNPSSLPLIPRSPRPSLSRSTCQAPQPFRPPPSLPFPSPSCPPQRTVVSWRLRCANSACPLSWPPVEVAVAAALEGASAAAPATSNVSTTRTGAAQHPWIPTACSLPSVAVQSGSGRADKVEGLQFEKTWSGSWGSEWTWASLPTTSVAWKRSCFSGRPFGSPWQTPKRNAP